MTQACTRIVIVGGVAGGASAATRARRCNEHAEIVLLEKDEFVSFANCGMPYHVGGEIPERGKLLVATKELLHRRFRLDARINRRRPLSLGQVSLVSKWLNSWLREDSRRRWRK